MNTRRLISLIVIASVILLLVLLLFRGCESRTGKFNWDETYIVDGSQPYDVSVFKGLLDLHSNKEVKVLKEIKAGELPVDDSLDAAYVFVGNGQYLDSTRLNPILDFVKSGHSAFISCRSVAYNLMFYIYYQECYDGYEYAYWDDFSVYKDTLVFMNYKHDALIKDSSIHYQAIGKNTTIDYRWQYINSMYFCEYDENGMVSIGHFSDSIGTQYTNFAKVKYGDGYFYLHTSPIALTNIQLLDTLGLDYVDGILSHIPKGQIYWDEASKVNESFSRRANTVHRMTLDNRMPEVQENPMKHILANKGTKWAWFGLIALGLIYIIFRAKRKQRIIPVLKANKNTSLDFISTIGGLYFKQRADRKLIETKMKLFFGKIRRKYDVYYRDNEEEQFIQKLASKAEVPEAMVTNILNMYNGKIKNAEAINDYDLVRLNQYIEDFYKQGK